MGALIRRAAVAFPFARRVVTADMLGATVIEPVRCELTSTSIRTEWLQAWQRAAEDPDDQPPPWLYAGAPAGIRRHPENKVVVPEASSESDVVNPETMAMDFATFASYTGSDEDQRVIEKIEGFVRIARSLEETTALLGEPPILCKLGMVIRGRVGRVKHASLSAERVI